MLDRAAEAGIRCLPLPTPFAVGRVNTYLIEDEPLTLLDAGPNSGKALDELEQALAAHGRRVEDLERIVVSHQHIDHLGLVSILARRSGAEVVALDLLAPWMAQYATRMELDDRYAEAVMRRHGIPRELRYALRAVTATFRGWGAAATATRTVGDGDELAFAGRSLRVHHRPGHSPSDTVFHDAQHGILLGADHLIGHISSNPLIARPLEGDADPVERPRSLMRYLESLRATRAMQGVDVVLAGHGAPVDDPVALIDERFAMHERRASKIERLIRDHPRTAYDIAQALWGNVAVTQGYLTLSEVLGHVDLLLDRGQVVERERDGVVCFEALR